MITFGRLESTKEINVTSVHDNVGEGDELIVLEVISYTGNDISVESDRNTTQITIVEDDSKLAVYMLALSRLYFENSDSIII